MDEVSEEVSEWREWVPPVLVLLTLLGVIVLVARMIVRNVMDPPLHEDARLSAVVTKDYLPRFETLGVDEVRVDWAPWSMHDDNNAAITTHGGSTAVFVDDNGSAIVFKAKRINSPTGDRIAVFANVDHAQVTLEEARSDVEQGITQAIKDLQAERKTAATWK